MARIYRKDIWSTAGDKTPVPTDAKIKQGWHAGEKPPHTAFNWMDNLVTQNMCDFTEMGILFWDKDTSYQKDGICNYKGNLYRSTIANNIGAGSRPDTAHGKTVWLPAITAVSANQGQMWSGANNVFVTPQMLHYYLGRIGIDIPKTQAIGRVVFVP